MNTKKITSLCIGLVLAFNLLAFLSISLNSSVYATGTTSSSDSDDKLATDPSKCVSYADKKGKLVTPRNCLFLLEPIGGKNNWDLYTISCTEDKMYGGTKCEYILYGGGVVPVGETGPVQAILTEDPDKPYQRPFGLMYSYVGLIYKYMSGLIVGVVVLYVVIGGIQITTAQGGEIDDGKARITKAIVGLIVWFTASLILYTINPTFFAF